MNPRNLAFALICLFVLPAALVAQQTTGALEGNVTDASGAVLPGVTVTISGPTILGGSQTSLTTNTGTYRLPNVPLGTYGVQFELSGFGTRTFEGVRIHAGATYSLNVKLDVAGIEEAVTVTAASPIIDTAATDTSFTFTNELLETVPNARDVWAIVAQTPGVAMGGLNIGGTQTGNQLSIRGHGVDPTQNNYVLNGASVTALSTQGNSQFYLDIELFQEVALEVSSHSADIQTPGMVVNMIPKSGTNRFRGAASFVYTTEGLQSDNVDDNLRSQGVDRASSLSSYIDVGGNLGGPIARDKAWFFVAYRWQEIERFRTGTGLVEGEVPTERTALWFPAVKVNWKIAEGHQSSGFYQVQQKEKFQSGLSAFRPPETTVDQAADPKSTLWSFRHDWVASDRLLFNFMVNFVDGGFGTFAQEGIDARTTPARLDLATRQWSGAPPNLFGVEEERRHFGVSANYYVDEGLGGQHDFKFGFDFKNEQSRGNKGGGAFLLYPGDHRLQFLDGEPLEVTLYTAGTLYGKWPTRSAYAQDSWQMGRVRLNLGIRWDWQANSLGETTGIDNLFLADTPTQAATDNLITWNTLAPRLGVVYDVRDDAKTLFKASYARYYWQLLADKANATSVAGSRSFRHTWNDLNGDNNFTIDELGPLLSVSDPATRPVTIQDALSPTLTDEFTVGVTHELGPNLSIGGTFRFRKDKDLTWQINQNVSQADYTPVTGTDPGRDGVLGTSDDGGELIFFEIDAAKRFASPNFITTRPGFSRQYQGFEATLYRRFSDNWQLVGSFTYGKQSENHGPGSFQNPQDIAKLDGTRIDESKPVIAKIMGSYRFAGNFTFSGFYQFLSGDNFTRMVNSTSALGRPLNQGNVSVLANKRNEDSYGGLNLIDLALAYDIAVGDGIVTLNFAVFNLFNINEVTNAVVTSGSSFGRVSNFVEPRIVRFGVRVDF